MKQNFNGKIIDKSNPVLVSDNRGYKYGDGLFETVKAVRGTLFFWEDHYFRLMASMRIMRMEIPMNFTMEFLQNEIYKTLEYNQLQDSIARVRLSIDRGNGGLYLPTDTSVNFTVETTRLKDEDEFYVNHKEMVKMDIYKDHFVNPGLLSTLKSNNRIINVLGSIYAKENDLENCFLLNFNKSVVEALAGNIFLVFGNIFKTPPLNDGCINGIMRKQVLKLIEKDEHYSLEEVSISPFELQKADEIFITNVIKGIKPVNVYRKKTYDTEVSSRILEKLNQFVSSSMAKEY